MVTVTINGTNDAAIISGTTTGSVIEAGGAIAHGTPTATGTLTDTDVDNTPNTFTAVGSRRRAQRLRHLHDDGGRRVDLHARQHQRAVQALNDCDTLTDTFTVTTVDGTAQVVTVTINGTNDAAMISGTATGSVTEAGACHARHADRDRHADRHRRRQYAQRLHGGRLADGERCGYGTFTMTAAACGPTRSTTPTARCRRSMSATR